MAREGFCFENAAAAVAFYERCEEAGAVTLEECLKVMRQMVKEKKAKYIRDAEAFAKGKKVLKISRKEIDSNA